MAWWHWAIAVAAIGNLAFGSLLRQKDYENVHPAIWAGAAASFFAFFGLIVWKVF